ncbi:MAG TPA: Crp/Fnr family transcriptional regulator [Terriglobales bacterium]|nr:Crp/Fnr family transcriptional regulator [Terriglobales bacterium]
MNSAYKNNVLRLLSPQSIERLHLHAMELPADFVLQTPGEEIQHIYFIESGLGSMATLFNDGHRVEAGIFGYESVISVSAFMGTRRPLNEISMELAGYGYRSTLKVAEKEYRLFDRFHELCLRYVQAQLMQATQTGACNATHTVEQRMARCLLLCRDRIDSDIIHLTHETLALTLGTRRTSVTLAAGVLQDLGLIDYSRGKIELLDPAGLERAACECYLVLRQHLHKYHEVETGFAV